MISVKAKRGHRRFSFRDFEIKIGRLRDLGEIGWKRNKVTYSKQYLGVYRRCIECGGKLIVTNYIGSDNVLEIVCKKCGLVHAIYGASFYQKETNEILAILRGEKEKQ